MHAVTHRVRSTNFSGCSAPRPCPLPGKQHPGCPGQGSSLLEGWSGRGSCSQHPAVPPAQPAWLLRPRSPHLAAQAWKLSRRVAKQLSARDPLARALLLPGVLPLSKEFISKNNMLWPPRRGRRAPDRV